MSHNKTEAPPPGFFRCKGCGDIFPFTKGKRKLCDECVRLKQLDRVRRYKQRTIGPLRKGDREEHFSGNSNFLEMIGGASHSEIARILHLSLPQVEAAERKGLMQIRANPELQKCWASLKEALASGIELSGVGLLARDRGEILLNYQLELARWWEQHDTADPELAREMEAELLALWQSINNSLK